MSPPSGTVSWWSGDGHADDIAGSNHGTLLFGTAFAPGKVGQAFSLDGADDYVSVPDAPSLNVGTGDFSLDAWIKTTDFFLQQIVDKRVDDRPTSIHGYGLAVRHRFGTQRLLVQLADGVVATNFEVTGVTLLDGVFHLKWPRKIGQLFKVYSTG